MNAIAILYIGYWGVKVADKTNKLEKAEQEIEKLKYENDSLRTIHTVRSRSHQ